MGVVYAAFDEQLERPIAVKCSDAIAQMTPPHAEDFHRAA